VAHPAGLLSWLTRKQHATVGYLDVGTPEFTVLGLLNIATELVSEHLHPITNSKYRNAKLDQFALKCWRSGSKYRSGSTGEDQPLRLALSYLCGANMMGQQLRADAKLANPSRDQLGVLTAVIEHDDLFAGQRRSSRLPSWSGLVL
jgi:hypothetical protein